MTTEVVPQVESDQKSIRLPQASQGRRLGESPHGSFLGRTMSISTTRVQSGKDERAPP